MRYFIQYWDGKRLHTLECQSYTDWEESYVDLSDAGLFDHRANIWTERV